MPVALVVAHEQVLAVQGTRPVGMRAVNLLPVLQSLFYGEKGRVGIDFIAYAVSLEEVQHFLNSRVVRCHFLWI